MEGRKGVYWFYLEYYVYLKVTSKRAILYNTLDSSFIIVEESAILSFLLLVESERKNGGIKVDFSANYNTCEFDVFFSNVRMKYMGDLVEEKYFRISPFQIPSIVKVKNDFRKTKECPSIAFMQNILFRLNLYISSVCLCDCSNCENLYKQVLSCRKFEYGIDLPVEVVSKLLSYKFDNLVEINLLGGNISNYYNLDDLLLALGKYREKCYVYYNYDNLNSITDKIKEFFQNRIVIIVNLNDFANDDLDFIAEYEKCKFVFLIENLQVYKRLKSLNVPSIYDIVPYFNGSNYSFFKDCVFLDEDDILMGKYNFVDIYKNQMLNNFSFGELTIFPNGDVYSNINLPVLGNIQNDTIYDLLEKCLLDDDSIWFLTRSKTECKNCVFVDMCPPIGNYEKVFDTNMLCKCINLL
ncbi:TIGR04150 pseudo-rSAM protein [Parabacteroides sp.]